MENLQSCGPFTFEGGLTSVLNKNEIGLLFTGNLSTEISKKHYPVNVFCGDISGSMSTFIGQDKLEQTKTIPSPKICYSKNIQLNRQLSISPDKVSHNNNSCGNIALAVNKLIDVDKSLSDTNSSSSDIHILEACGIVDEEDTSYQPQISKYDRTSSLSSSASTYVSTIYEQLPKIPHISELNTHEEFAYTRTNVIQQGLNKYFDTIKALIKKKTIPGIVFCMIVFGEGAKISINPIIITLNNIDSVKKNSIQSLTSNEYQTNFYAAFEKMIEIEKEHLPNLIKLNPELSFGEINYVLATDGDNNDKLHSELDIIKEFAIGKKFFDLKKNLTMFGIGDIDDYNVNFFKSISPGHGFSGASSGIALCDLISGEFLDISTIIANDIILTFPASVDIVSGLKQKNNLTTKTIMLERLSCTQVVPLRITTTKPFETFKIGVSYTINGKKQDDVIFNIIPHKFNAKNTNADLFAKLARIFNCYSQAASIDIKGSDMEKTLPQVIITLEKALLLIHSWDKTDRIESQSPLKSIWEAYEKEIEYSHNLFKQFFENYRDSPHELRRSVTHQYDKQVTLLNAVSERATSGYIPLMGRLVSNNIVSMPTESLSGLSRFSSNN